VEAHGFDLEEALSRVAALPEVTQKGADTLRRAVQGVERLSWGRLIGIMRPPGPEEAIFWDFVLIGSEVLVPERTGFPDLLPASSADEWSQKLED